MMPVRISRAAIKATSTAHVSTDSRDLFEGTDFEASSVILYSPVIVCKKSKLPAVGKSMDCQASRRCLERPDPQLR